MSETLTTSQPGVGDPGVEPENVDSPSVVLWGVVSVVLVICTMLFAIALYNQVNSRLVKSKIYAPVYNDSLQSLNSQLSAINRYAIPSNANPHHQVPIDDAMKLVVKELSAAQAKIEN